ncbi:MAG TPA: glycosyl hydrolase family 18 protein [Clostridia bacterium]|nr:glycosyl hydrolase family 18 protein [Clostridia bacterium]
MYFKAKPVFALIAAFLFLLCYMLESQSALAAGSGQEQQGTIVNCKQAVNVRSGPGTGYKKLGTAPRGEIYPVLQALSGWYKISYRGKIGYVSKNYMTVSAVSSGDSPAGDTSDVTGTVVNCNSAVNVRGGPGTGYQKLGTAKKGASYSVLNREGDWYKISYSKKTGYIHSSYLSLRADATQQNADTCTVVSGYYASWAAYSGFTPLDLQNVGQLTHIFYAFANISSGLKVMMGDPEVDPANFQELLQLKQQYPQLKTILSVGGWTWSARFSDAASTQARREAFADSAAAFIAKYGFDGIDIDWEFPVSGGLSTNKTRAADKENFTLLMKTLREKLNAHGILEGKQYLLTFAGPNDTACLKNMELQKVAPYVDFALAMTYDMHGGAGRYTDFNAPLYTPSESSPQHKWSCDDAVNAWLRAGFPREKLILGIPFYGRQFTKATAGGDGLYQTFFKASSVNYDVIAAQYLSDPSYTQYLHPDARVPWLYNGSTFLSYDDAQSIAEKAAYIKARGLRGAGIWELSQNADGTLLKTLYNGMSR